MTTKDIKRILFGRDGDVLRYASGQWITVGADKSAPPGDKGGTHVFIEGGKVTHGPKGLVGRALKKKSAKKSSKVRRAKASKRTTKKKAKRRWR